MFGFYYISRLLIVYVIIVFCLFLDVVGLGGWRMMGLGVVMLVVISCGILYFEIGVVDVLFWGWYDFGFEGFLVVVVIIMYG